MSGQFGIWNLNGKSVTRSRLDEAAPLLARNGCDADNIYSGRSIAILYSAFHTTEEAVRELQPFPTRSGLVVTWDGRLDNRKELIAARLDILSDHSTDVEIVAATFEALGTRAFSNLVGDWAVSIWAPAANRLFLAKDYVGVRHLYYCLRGEELTWSSYLPALMHALGSPLTVNDDYVAGYLASFPSAEATPYCEIQSVAPGAFVTVGNGSIRTGRHWCFPVREIRYKCDSEYEEHFCQLFRQAVLRRLRSNGPVLGELSGGIDSSSIICMADEVINSGTAGTARLDTISTYDASEPGGDERPYFVQIEQKRGRVGHHLNRQDYGNSLDLNYENLIPFPGSSECRGRLKEDLTTLFHTHGYRTLLSGIGGDEFMGGIPNPLPQLADFILVPHPVRLAKALAAWSLAKKRPWIHLLGQAVATLFPPPIRALTIPHAAIPAWIDARFARRHQFPVLSLGPVDRFGFWRPSRREAARTLIAMRRQMACLPAFGVAGEERRYPYLDQSLIEFLLAIPPDQLLRPGQRRSLMRRALAAVVPKEILWRKTKAFVSRSVLVAFDKSWPELQELFSSPIAGAMGYVIPPELLQDLRLAKSGNAEHMMYLLKVISLELWLRSVATHGLIRVPGASDLHRRSLAPSGTSPSPPLQALLPARRLTTKERRSLT